MRRQLGVVLGQLHDTLWSKAFLNVQQTISHSMVVLHSRIQRNILFMYKQVMSQPVSFTKEISLLNASNIDKFIPYITTNKIRSLILMLPFFTWKCKTLKRQVSSTFTFVAGFVFEFYFPCRSRFVDRFQIVAFFTVKLTKVLHIKTKIIYNWNNKWLSWKFHI